MKRLFVLTLTEEEAIRLCQILLDRDEKDALAFLHDHASKQLRDFLEGG